jgi:hypothetical protein
MNRMGLGAEVKRQIGREILMTFMKYLVIENKINPLQHQAFFLIRLMTAITCVFVCVSMNVYFSYYLFVFIC